MDSEDEIKHEYQAGELASIYAIERLQKLRLQPKDAEALVKKWDEDTA
jgi:hypothetical protein